MHKFWKFSVLVCSLHRITLQRILLRTLWEHHLNALWEHNLNAYMRAYFYTHDTFYERTGSNTKAKNIVWTPYEHRMNTVCLRGLAAGKRTSLGKTEHLRKKKKNTLMPPAPDDPSGGGEKWDFSEVFIIALPRVALKRSLSSAILCVCVCVCVFVCVCVCVWSYTYIYTHTHTQIYIYTTEEKPF
jgi:hypothetical protein